jgi:type I restriction enzyme M protein
MATDPKQPLTLKALEDHLWESADLFRNKISNQKDYVLPLLFFKRASDRFHEERANALENDLAGVPADAAVQIIEANPAMYHSVIVPSGHFFDDVRGADKETQGKALNDALREIGRANPKQLSGVFENIDFNNKTALPADDLHGILDHFHALGPLTNKRVTPDMLGAAYEWLIAKFAAGAGKGGGEFYTPAAVGKLGARLLAPGPTDEAYDPTCGSGGLLLQVLDEARRLHGNEARGLAIFGQEINPETWAIARMNMLLHGASGAATVERGDTLKEPKFIGSSGLRRFDLVIANPPFSPKNWGHDWLKKSGDPFGRIMHVPPKSHGEIAFVQHMVASLNDHGRMAVVLPNGVFFRKGSELEVRKDLVNADIVEAVIQLPKDMFYGAGIPACYLVVNKPKRAELKEKVLFIDGSECFERTDTKNHLRDSDIHRIVEAFRATQPDEGFCAVASSDEIKALGYSLTVRRYVSSSVDDGVIPSLDDALAAYRSAAARRKVAEAAAERVLDALQPKTV